MMGMLRQRGKACRQAATERQRSGGEFILGKGVVVDGGRLGYMTFVSMVMVSLCLPHVGRWCFNVCVFLFLCVHVCNGIFSPSCQ